MTSEEQITANYIVGIIRMIAAFYKIEVFLESNKKDDLYDKIIDSFVSAYHIFAIHLMIATCLKKQDD